jgi:hypothetical protein
MGNAVQVNSNISGGLVGTPDIDCGTGSFTGDVDIADKIIHTGDTNTAIRFPAADTFTVETGGSERVRVDSSGRFLVGVNASQSVGFVHRLQVEGTDAGSSSISLLRNSNDSSSAQLNLAKTRGTSTGSNTVVQDDDSLGEIKFRGADGTDKATEGARITAAVDGTPGSNDMPGRLTFHTTADGASSPTERLRIDSSGRVLLNTNSARTNYFNSTSYGPLLNLEGTGNSNRVLSFIHNDNSGAPLFVLGATGGSTAGSNTIIGSSGKFGFLSFQGADGAQLVEGAKITGEVDGTPGSDDMPGRLVFSTTADGAATTTERLRITAAGNVSIQNDSGKFTAGAGDDLLLYHDGSQSYIAGDDIRITNKAVSETMAKFLANGAVELNHNDSKKLETTSTGVTVTGDVNSTSDIDLKKDIEVVTSATEMLNQLRGVKFTWKKNDEKSVGVIAQEVETILPELVKGEEGDKSVNYSGLVGVLIEAVKELSARVEELENR